MVEDNDEIPRVPGIRAVSSFYRNFDGEDVVIRPATLDRDAFKIEVLLNSGKAVFPPTAPVREGDVAERDDPRGGVIEYLISRYEFSKDPFGHGNDHWEALLVEKGHASRSFAQPSIVVHGGTNQIAVGSSNHLQQINIMPAAQEVLSSLDEIQRDMPRQDLSSSQLEEVDEAIADAKETIVSADHPAKVKRTLYGIKGIVEEIASSAETGVKDAVKVWVAAATAMLIKHITGI